MSDELSPRRAEMKRLADAGRLVIERMASTDAPHEAVERAAELLEAAARELDGPGKARKYDGFAESANAGGDPHAHFDHSPIMGMANPIAPPTRIEWGDGDTVNLHVRFGSAYEGPPGSVHGGVAGGDVRRGARHDAVAERAARHDRHADRAYRQPTPLHRDLRFEGTLERVEGRKIFTRGRLLRRRHADGRGRGPLHPRRLPEDRRR